MHANTTQRMLRTRAMVACRLPPSMSLRRNLLRAEIEQISAGIQKMNNGKNMTKLTNDHLKEIIVYQKL